MMKISAQMPVSLKLEQSQEWRVGVCLLLQAQCVGNESDLYCVAATGLIVLYGFWFTTTQQPYV